MMLMNIGVIGQGFVGNAIARAFNVAYAHEKVHSVETYDKYVSDRTSLPLDELVAKSDVVFVCVPSPMRMDDGGCDTSIVEQVFHDIAGPASSKFSGGGRRTVAIVKSTVPPGTTDALQERHRAHGVDVVFSPEFLNARSAFEDFISQDHVILGGEDDATLDAVAHLYASSILPDAQYVKTSAKCAEAVKYIKNCFFAAKVSIANEMFQVCDALGVSYDEAIAMAQLDDRVGWEHWKVPGPTPGVGPWAGRPMMGWGGACLAKDSAAFRKLAKGLGVKTTMMDAAWEKNLEVRPERDWEYLQGAVDRPRKPTKLDD